MSDVRTIEAIGRQLASVIHAARTAGPYNYHDTGNKNSLEQGLQNAKRKLLGLIADALEGRTMEAPR